MDIHNFLKTVGVNPTLAKYLINPEDESIPEGFDAKAAMAEYTASQSKVWLEKLKPEIETQVGEKHDRTRRTLAKTLVDTFDLEISKTEAFELGFDKVLEMVPPVIKARIDAAANGTDDELRKELDKYKKRSRSLEDELNEAKESHKTELETANKAADAKIHNFQVRDVLGKKFAKLEYGVGKGVINLFQESAANRILEKYNMDLDGSLFSKDDNSEMPVSFDGKRTYKNVDEAIQDLAEEFDVLKKSNVPAERGGPGGKGGAGEKSENTKRMEERFRQAREKQNV